MQLDTKHKVLVNLLKIQLSSEFSDIVESLLDLKQLLAGNTSKDAA